MVSRETRYLQAGVGYLGLGTLVILLHLFSPDLAAERRWQEAAHLVTALPFLLLFAVLLAWGDRIVAVMLRVPGMSSDRALRWGRRVQDGAALLLTLTALGRTIVFGANGVGWSPRVRTEPLRLEAEASSPEPLMFVAALLTAGIVGLLVRAAWLPLFRRH